MAFEQDSVTLGHSQSDYLRMPYDMYASSPVKNVTVDNKQNCVLIGADSHSKHSQGDANDDV